MTPVTGLYACPSCDCLFVSLVGPSGARCPLCKTPSTHSGRDWMARRAEQRSIEESAVEPAAVRHTVAASTDLAPGDAFSGLEGRF